MTPTPIGKRPKATNANRNGGVISIICGSKPTANNCDKRATPYKCSGGPVGGAKLFREVCGFRHVPDDRFDVRRGQKPKIT
jgi:hypothetical protein